MATLESLPKDIIALIAKELDIEDMFALYRASKTLTVAIDEKIWHDLTHQCIAEIENEWNTRAPYVARDARSEYGSRTKHPYTADAFYSREHWDCQCSIFPWRTHNLSLEYNYCPRDVDILVWFQDGEKHGYTMF